MFSIRQKREIADAVQRILRATNHPELPHGEIEFRLHVQGADSGCWADIRNNGAVPKPAINPHNEAMEAMEAMEDIECLGRSGSDVPVARQLKGWS